jgi:hypothetical protein
MIVVYPIGIPAFFFIMLMRYRKRLDEIGVRAELGFIYDAYERNVWWFEMADMLHKLIVTSLIGFLPFEYQMPIGMCIVVIYMWVILRYKPYLRKSDDRLHLFAQCEIILLLMSGNIFNRLTTPDPFMDVVLSIALIIIVLAFFAFFMLQAAQALKKMCAKREKRPSGDMMSELDGRPVQVDPIQLKSPKDAEKLGSLDMEMVAIDRRLLRPPKAAQPEGETTDMRRNPVWSSHEGQTERGASVRTGKTEEPRPKLTGLFDEGSQAALGPISEAQFVDSSGRPMSPTQSSASASVSFKQQESAPLVPAPEQKAEAAVNMNVNPMNAGQGEEIVMVQNVWLNQAQAPDINANVNVNANQINPNLNNNTEPVNEPGSPPAPPM